MAIQTYNRIYNCTPAQFATAMSTTLPNAGFSILQAPIQFQGLVTLNSVKFTGALTAASATVATPSSLAGLTVGMTLTDTTNPGFLTAGTKIATVTPTLTITPVAAGGTGTTDQLVASGAPSQIDFSYDGAFFIRFYGANPLVAIAENPQGITQTQLDSDLITYLDQTLLATLGAPVPSNQAVPPYNTNSI
jgi:hypothetical protein